MCQPNVFVSKGITTSQNMTSPLTYHDYCESKGASRHMQAFILPRYFESNVTSKQGLDDRLSNSFALLACLCMYVGLLNVPNRPAQHTYLRHRVSDDSIHERSVMILGLEWVVHWQQHDPERMQRSAISLSQLLEAGQGSQAHCRCCISTPSSAAAVSVTTAVAF